MQNSLQIKKIFSFYIKLQLAKATLEKSLNQPKDEFIRDSSIQRFEYTFELSWKLLQKIIQFENLFFEGGTSRVIWEASRLQIISNAETWIKFLDRRNLTTHEYAELYADDVYASLREFLPLVQEILDYVEKIYGKYFEQELLLN